MPLLTYWPSFAPWRVLYAPTEKRWWRCRPTVAGVELGFRADDETEWSTRVVHKPRIKPSGMIVRDREDAQQATTRAAIPLVAEQLAEGMEDRSPPASEQLWDQLVQDWREEDPSFDVARLVSAQEQVTQPALANVKTWLAECAVADVPKDLAWWPPIPAARQEAATAALVEHATAILPALLLALRHVYGAHAAIRSALRAAAPLPDDTLLFEALLSRTVSNPPWRLQDAVAFTNLIGTLCAPSPERVARLQPIVDAAPQSITQHSAEAHYQKYVVGFELGLVLKAWATRYGTSL